MVHGDVLLPGGCCAGALPEGHGELGCQRAPVRVGALSLAVGALGLLGEELRMTGEHERLRDPLRRQRAHGAVLDCLDVSPQGRGGGGLPVGPGIRDRDVHPSVVLEVFPDVLDTLAELKRRGVRLAVVSDAWPNLPDLHEGLGIRDYFEVYAISAVLGCEKPDPRMYHHASTGLGLKPSECLFVDDLPGLVSAAMALGYKGRALCRTAATDQVPSIMSLTELLELV